MPDGTVTTRSLANRTSLLLRYCMVRIIQNLEPVSTAFCCTRDALRVLPCCYYVIPTALLCLLAALWARLSSVPCCVGLNYRGCRTMCQLFSRVHFASKARTLRISHRTVPRVIHTITPATIRAYRLSTGLRIIGTLSTFPNQSRYFSADPSARYIRSGTWNPPYPTWPR